MPQKWVPQLPAEDVAAWLAAADAAMACPVRGCGRTSPAWWDGENETLRWVKCGHVAFLPEDPSGLAWPPPESHIRRGGHQGRS